MMPRDRRIPNIARTARTMCVLAGLLVSASLSAPSALASSTPTVDLGQAAGYAVISGASVANTGNSTVRGDIGSPTAASGFPPGVQPYGTMQVGSADTTAYNDFLTAYSQVQSRTGGSVLPALAGSTLTPGLYSSSAAAGMAASTGATLDAGGNPNAVFVIQVNGALTLGAGAEIQLTGGAQASNVFWQVNGAFAAGAGAEFVGTVMTGQYGLDRGRRPGQRAGVRRNRGHDERQRVLFRAAHDDAHGRRCAGPQQFQPDDWRNHRRRHFRSGHGYGRRADSDDEPGLRRQLVGDPDDIGQWHLRGAGLHRRRGGEPGYRQPTADD
jgi:hypothetical protein